MALSFTLPTSGETRLELFDVGGRRVRAVAEGELAAGVHQFTWDGRHEGGGVGRSGLYWARLTTGGQTLIRKFTVMP